MRRFVIRAPQAQPPSVPPPKPSGSGLGTYLQDAEVPKKRATKSTYLAPLDAAVMDAEKRATSGDWARAKGATLVGLYAWCHRRVYGADVEELRVAAAFKEATRVAAKLLHECGDDPDFVAEMIRWTWEREKRAESTARHRGDTRDFRVTWRYQFSPKMLTSYRVELSRRGKGAA